MKYFRIPQKPVTSGKCRSRQMESSTGAISRSHQPESSGGIVSKCSPTDVVKNIYQKKPSTGNPMSRNQTRNNTADIIVIGAGIVGLATAWRFLQRYPDSNITVLDKEHQVGVHQSGHNSGVIHSGIYYKPGSKRAEYCREGRKQLIAFCDEHRIPYEICGKVIVAVREEQLGQLDRLYQRGMENRIEDLAHVDRRELRKIEPGCRGIAGLRVGATGIVDFRQVCHVLANLISENGGTIVTGSEVTGIHGSHDGTEDDNAIEIITNKTVRTTGTKANANHSGNVADTEISENRTFRCRSLINCAGLQSDRIAHMAGFRPDLRIIPFRGEYYKLKESRRHLVRSLIYPLPDENFPFLGVHLTRMIHGDVECGPNAVLALARERYSRWGWQWSDVRDTIYSRGFRKLARRHWKTGLVEIQRSFSKRMFTKAVQELVPEIKPGDMVPATPGIRATAVNSDGNIIDDFHFEEAGNQLHVLNAPSPAATASLRISEEIAARCPL